MTYRMQSGTVGRFAAFVALVVAPALLGYAADSSGAHVFARYDNGTNIVSRLVPDGTDVATMLAVDRLWDRSTNSFLKAEWENGDSTRSRIVESGAGIDFYMYDGDWYRESRWGFNGLKIWGDDYVEVTGGDAPGLWVGASAVGDNNILNIPSIGYCNGYVALRGPADDYYYDKIFFPTRVGEGRDNVFALTKDIYRATNALYGAVSGALDSKIDPSNAMFSNAVLAVGFNVDTNTVAAINALLAESGEGGLPVGGMATAGALLAALVAALAALKRKSGTVTSPLRMLGEDGAWYLVGVDSSGEFYVRKEGSEPAFHPADPDDPELAGTISTEGEVNDDGTFTVEGQVNEDGTLSVEV